MTEDAEEATFATEDLEPVTSTLVTEEATFATEDLEPVTSTLVTEEATFAIEDLEPLTSTLVTEEESAAIVEEREVGGAVYNSVCGSVHGAECTTARSSLRSALLFACAMLALLRIVVVFSRCIGDVLRTYMVRTSTFRGG